jgi:hypothetical protein
MKAKIVYQLVGLALSFAQRYFQGPDLERILAGVIRKGVQTYEAQTGAPLDPELVGILKPYEERTASGCTGGF